MISFSEFSQELVIKSIRAGLPHVTTMSHEQTGNLLKGGKVYLTNMTEKTDGMNMKFGHDENGFYTQSTGSGNEKMRSPEDYENRARARAETTGKPLDLTASNAFRDIHSNLASNKVLRRHLEREYKRTGKEVAVHGEIFYKKFGRPSGISNEEFSKHKSSVGDIDVKVPREHFDTLQAHLIPGSRHGKYTVVGVKKSGTELHAIMKHDNGQHHQVDFEKSTYEGNEPSKFDEFAHSSDWEDTKSNFKGMHHKLLLNASGLDHHKFSVAYGLKSRTDDSEPWEPDTKKITSTLFGKDADHNQLGSFHGITQLIKKHVPVEQHQAIYDKFKTDIARAKGIDNSAALAHLKKHLDVKE